MQSSQSPIKDDLAHRPHQRGRGAVLALAASVLATLFLGFAPPVAAEQLHLEPQCAAEKHCCDMQNAGAASDVVFECTFTCVHGTWLVLEVWLAVGTGSHMAWAFCDGSGMGIGSGSGTIAHASTPCPWNSGGVGQVAPCNWGRLNDFGHGEGLGACRFDPDGIEVAFAIRCYSDVLTGGLPHQVI